MLNKKNLTAAILGTSLIVPLFSAPILAEETAFPVTTESSSPSSSVTLVPEESMGNVSEGKLGSISINLEDSADGRSKENVVFGVVKVADVNNGQYEIDPSLGINDIDLNKLETANDMEKAAIQISNVVEDKNIELMNLKTDSDGKVVCNDLPIGVYLFYVKDVADYEFITPFLVAIPTWNDKDGEMLYDIEVFPKHNQLPKIQVNKVDEKSGKNITNNEFAFTSYSDPDCKKEIDTVKGQTETGTAVFEVDYGTTYIKETKAPKGYLLSDEVVKIDVTDEGIFVNDKLAKSEDELLYSIVYNNSMEPFSFNNVSTSTQLNAATFATALAVSGFTILIIVKKMKKEN